MAFLIFLVVIAVHVENAVCLDGFYKEIPLDADPPVMSFTKRSASVCALFCSGEDNRLILGTSNDLPYCWKTAVYRLEDQQCFCNNDTTEFFHNVSSLPTVAYVPMVCWKSIQRRVSDEISFERTWDEYKNGFGDRNTNFWLGLDKIHELTQGVVRAIFQVTDWDDVIKTAEYSHFKVDTEANKYKLTISGHSGNLCDSMNYHNNMIFVTKDRDTTSNGCVNTYKGGWWYNTCHHVNLNGHYWNLPHAKQTTVFATGLNWYCYKGHYYSFKKVEILVAVDQSILNKVAI